MSQPMSLSTGNESSEQEKMEKVGSKRNPEERYYIVETESSSEDEQANYKSKKSRNTIQDDEQESSSSSNYDSSYDSYDSSYDSYDSLTNSEGSETESLVLELRKNVIQHDAEKKPDFSNIFDEEDFQWLYEIPEFDDDGELELYVDNDEYYNGSDAELRADGTEGHRNKRSKSFETAQTEAKTNEYSKKSGATKNAADSARLAPDFHKRYLQQNVLGIGSPRKFASDHSNVEASHSESEQIRDTSSKQKQQYPQVALNQGAVTPSDKTIPGDASESNSEGGESSEGKIDSESAITKLWGGLSNSLATIRDAWRTTNNQTETSYSIEEEKSNKLDIEDSRASDAELSVSNIHKEIEESPHHVQKAINAVVLNNLMNRVFLVDSRFHFVEASGISGEALNSYKSRACAICLQLPEEIFQMRWEKLAREKLVKPDSKFVQFRIIDDNEHKVNSVEVAVLHATMNSHSITEPTEVLMKLSPLHDVLAKSYDVAPVDRSKAISIISEKHSITEGYRFITFVLSRNYKKGCIYEFDGTSDSIIQHMESTKENFVMNVSQIISDQFIPFTEDENSLYAFVLIDSEDTSASRLTSASAEKDYLNMAISKMLNSGNENGVGDTIAEFYSLTDADTEEEASCLYETCSAIVLHLPLSAWEKIWEDKAERLSAGNDDLADRLFFLSHSNGLEAMNRSIACVHILSNINAQLINDPTLSRLVKDCKELPPKVRTINYLQNKPVYSKYSNEALGIETNTVQPSHFISFIRVQESETAKIKILSIDSRLNGPITIYHNSKKGNSQFVYDVQDYITHEFLENPDLNLTLNEADQFYIFQLCEPLRKPKPSMTLPLVQLLPKGAVQKSVEFIAIEHEKQKQKREEARRRKAEAAAIAEQNEHEERNAAEEKQRLKEEEKKVEEEKRERVLEAEARALQANRRNESNSGEHERIQTELEDIRKQQIALALEREALENEKERRESERQIEIEKQEAENLERERLEMLEKQEAEEFKQEKNRNEKPKEVEQENEDETQRAVIADGALSTNGNKDEKKETQGEVEEHASSPSHSIDLKKQQQEEEERLRKLEEEEEALRQKQLLEEEKRIAKEKEEAEKERLKKEAERQKMLQLEAEGERTTEEIEKVAKKLREQKKLKQQKLKEESTKGIKVEISSRPFDTDSINSYLHEVLQLPKNIKVLGEFTVSEVSEKVEDHKSVIAFVTQYPASVQAQRHRYVLSNSATLDECYYSVSTPENDRGLSCATAVVNAVINNEHTVDLGKGFLHDITASADWQTTKEQVSHQISDSSLVFPKRIKDSKHSKYVYTSMVCVHDEEKYCLFEIDGSLPENHAIMHGTTKPSKFFDDALLAIKRDHCKNYDMEAKDIRIYPLASS